MSNLFFTADTHFRHQLCVEKRGFSTAEEHDERLIENWNSVIKKGDRVYHLGDVALCHPELASKILKRLNGQIFLIEGNHDKAATHSLCRDRFVWIKDYHYLHVGEQRISLLHYAMLTWRNAYRGTWHLHGHSHGSLPEDPYSRRFDVGVDCWGLMPVSYEQVCVKMATKKNRPAFDLEGAGNV